ncbi:hypothetical protein BA6E_121306 [Bacteroidales bacterium 6E]|nr:hypothetical protein BA6E_121306 [Bacteroidales bacterium 6E]
MKIHFRIILKYKSVMIYHRYQKIITFTISYILSFLG